MGFRIMVFPDISQKGRASSIEVAQGYIMKAVGHAVVTQHVFNHEFCPAIDIRWMKGHVFRNRNLVRFPVNGRRRRKDDILDAAFPHGVKKTQSTSHIVIVIFPGSTMDSPTWELAAKCRTASISYWPMICFKKVKS